MTRNEPFLDTNILIRFLTGDEPRQAQACRRLMAALADGRREAWTSHLVIAEAVFTLSRYYELDRPTIARKLGLLASLRGLRIRNKRMFADVFALYVEHPGVDYADCYHAVLAASEGCTQVLSYDKQFDLLPGVARILPE